MTVENSQIVLNLWVFKKMLCLTMKIYGFLHKFRLNLVVHPIWTIFLGWGTEWGRPSFWSCYGHPFGPAFCNDLTWTSIVGGSYNCGPLRSILDHKVCVHFWVVLSLEPTEQIYSIALQKLITINFKMLRTRVETRIRQE